MNADTTWRTRALCAGMDPYEIDATFFPHPNDNAADAKKICRMCPVASECLVDAIENKEEFGVRGAMTEQERRPLLNLTYNGGHPIAKCGTESGYRRHVRRKEATCERCKAANRVARALREEQAS